MERLSSSQARYLLHHVFMPIKLPQESDLDLAIEHTLSALIHDSSIRYRNGLLNSARAAWTPVVKMLRDFAYSQECNLSAARLQKSFANLHVGESLALLVRAQNAGLIIRKSIKHVTFESFEVSPPTEAVMGSLGKLRCSYPGPAISIPAAVFADLPFLRELSSFLAHMHVDSLDGAVATTKKAGSTVVEERNTTHPRYITELLTGILRGMGQVAEVTRISKRIADDALWKDTHAPWRRSSTWLVLRVALQTTLYKPDRDRHQEYKSFMLFFLSELLQAFMLVPEFSSEDLHMARAKLSRRLYKLRSSLPIFVSSLASSVVDGVEVVLKQRWLMVQQSQTFSPPWAPETLDPAADTLLQLKICGQYLAKLKKHRDAPTPCQVFSPSHLPRTLIFGDHGELTFSYPSISSTFIALADFEESVTEGIDRWILIPRSFDELQGACELLEYYVSSYSSAAIVTYAKNPENESLMLLTIFELWVALDKLSIRAIPLLDDYLPEIPWKRLDSLLLREKRSMDRLTDIQEYVQSRNRKSRLGSVFSDNTTSNSFSIRYYDQSSELKTLRRKIENDAEEVRQRKRVELERSNAEHVKLLERVEEMTHDYFYAYRRRQYVHDWHCQKCRAEQSANALTIAVHEWPLPSHPKWPSGSEDNDAKLVVFESRCPPVFAIWRSVTYQILCDICSPKKPKNKTNPPVNLRNYSGLSQYVKGTTPRISIASSTKSFAKSHYDRTKVPATESEVLVNNGLQYRLFDNDSGAWAAEPFGHFDISAYCTLMLPSHGPYSKMQYAVSGTNHTSNDVLAQQSDCPKELSLHEFIAFGTLRAGHRLQWMNIAREIRAKAFSFQQPEVNVLLMQAVWQVGPSSGKQRECHLELVDANFGTLLLDELKLLLQTVETNWQEVSTVRTIVGLTSRLLEFAIESPEVVKNGCILLKRAHLVVEKWMETLQQRLRDAENEDEASNLRLRLCETAATCQSTYNVSTSLLPHLIITPQDIASYIRVAVILNDNSPPISTVSNHLRRLLDQNRRLARRIEVSLRGSTSKTNEGMHLALERIVPDGYSRGAGWSRMCEPNGRWYITRTGTPHGQIVHLDVLDGRLLVDGKPLGRLPSEVMQHSLYKRTFGKLVLDVVPSAAPGLQFATCSNFGGYRVYFAYDQESNHLVIKAEKEGCIHELVPHRELVGDFPILLIENHAHWFNLRDGSMEFRPLSQQWESAPATNWILQHQSKGKSTMSIGNETKLLDVHSKTFLMLSSRLQPLEYPENIIITLSSSHSQPVEVKLPRFRLSFTLNATGCLESNNIIGTVIDERRHSGALIGLRNQVILRPVGSPASSRILIPQGRIEFGRTDDHHAFITIDTRSLPHVHYHEYRIDTHLGRLVADSTLLSHLCLTYFHALSSHCLPDPLLGCTGTEQALSLLYAAKSRSFQKLGKAEAEVLHAIGHLTPQREWYPRHLQNMQTVEWLELPVLSQHPGFEPEVLTILGYATELSTFHPADDCHAYDRTPSTDIMERADQRASTFSSQAVLYYRGNEPPSDTIYHSRDLHASGSEEEDRAFRVSSMIYRWPLKIPTETNLYAILCEWSSITGPGSVESLSYSRSWLTDTFISNHWMSLYEMLRTGSKDHLQPLLLFSLSAAAFSGFYPQTLLCTLLAFAMAPEIRRLVPPSWPEYDLCEGYVPDSSSVLQAVRESLLPAESAPEFRISPSYGETAEQHRDRCEGLFNARIESTEQDLVNRFMAQWPAQAVTVPQTSLDSAFDLQMAISGVSNLFHEWFKNMELYDHLNLIQGCLDRVRGPVPLIAPEHRFSACLDESMSLAPGVTLSHLLHSRRVPHIKPPSASTQKIKLTYAKSPQPQLDALNTLFGEFEGSQSQLRQHYGKELESSRTELEMRPPRFRANPTSIAVAGLEEYQRECRLHLNVVLASVRGALRPESLAEKALLTAGLWPRCTVRQLLGSLSSRSGVECPDIWKTVLAALCFALMWYQRSQRLLGFALSHNHDELLKEFENEGYNSEDMRSLENVEWLLVQVDNDFLMRRMQAKVAKEMITPSSGHNTATQLNMGEGKTAVIVPVISTTLADGDKLVRVVVLKPLAAQMFQLLVERVSGLANQQVFYLPFTRGFDMTKISVVQSLLSKCANQGGVLVIQPEHILSLRLMAVHRILSAVQMHSVLELQRWLERKSRDVLDESDEILHVRYQMVYTIGLQRALEDQPDRWATTQQVLGLVKKHVPTIFAQYPDGVEVAINSIPTIFPHVRFTHKNACEALVSLIVEDVLAGHLDNLSFDRLGSEGRQAARAMLTQQYPANHSFLRDPTFQSDGLFKGLLLLRGLLYQGVLAYALSQRRWRVDYGLHLSRTLLAVPYRAKDVPSLRAEFGHPDVAIVLTCLSYYYGGLRDDEVDLCFSLLLQLDNPDVEYEQWTRGTVIPQELCSLGGVNLQDPAQVQNILRPMFSPNHVVIDFYLSRVVFPKAAKEFPHKLSTSAWDLAESKCHPTTGFSGTNDNHPLLPLSITQTDPLQQLSTNAQVLSYLLQPENNFYCCMESSTSKVASCIEMIVSEKKEIRVLLDVGAQMLDMKNRELAAHWLRSRSQDDVDAVVFFGDDDEKYVIVHDGTVAPLVSSPFRRQLDRCLLYLDDAHTRGSDFKLPGTWRAAVTLGPGVSKDRLTQGCMRMRQLGLGQSVLFLAPLEVDRSIRKLVNKSDSDNITTYDVLHWSMEETCRDIEHHLPRWAHQGLDYKARNDEWEQLTTSPSDSFRAVWQQPEARSLQDMYGFEGSPRPVLQTVEQDYPELHERCSRYGVSSLSNNQMEEEQEREVSHEIERERQVERPRKAKAVQHSLDDDVSALIHTGSISKFSPAFESVYLPWNSRLDSRWKSSPTVLATKDFLQVVQGVKTSLTEYMRPVTWIMSFTVAGTTSLLLLSPYEVNELLPAIRRGTEVHLHMYSPRVTEATESFENLNFFCIPPLPASWIRPTVLHIVELNLWAGQLYLRDYENYLEVCRFLGLYVDALYGSSDTPAGLDGFVRREHRRHDNQSWFIKTPLPLLKDLFGLRRKGQSFLKTHMGKILHGKTLRRDDF